MGTQFTVGFAELQRLAEMACIRGSIHYGVKRAVYTALEVGRTCGQQLTIMGMKSTTQHCALKLLLEMLANPPDPQ